MPTIARSVDIRVSAEQAFEYMADLNNLPKYYEGVSELHLVGEKTRGLGLIFACKIDVPHKGPLGCTFKITDFIDYILIAIHSTSGPKSEGIWHFARMAGINVKTRITYTLTYQIPVPIIGGLIDLFFIRSQMLNRVEQTLINLKTNLEEKTK